MLLLECVHIPAMWAAWSGIATYQFLLAQSSGLAVSFSLVLAVRQIRA